MNQKRPSASLKSFSHRGVFLIFTILPVLLTSRTNFGASVWVQPKNQSFRQENPQNKVEGKRTGGIVGDPSRHRGFELGYDAGPKAGSEDRAKNKNPDPSIRPEYKKPEQFYRYEYGSRSSFISGFRSGFLRSYKNYFGEIGFKHTETTQETASAAFHHLRKAPSESVKPREPLPKNISLAKDAL